MLVRKDFQREILGSLIRILDKVVVTQFSDAPISETTLFPINNTSPTKPHCSGQTESFLTIEIHCIMRTNKFQFAALCNIFISCCARLLSALMSRTDERSFVFRVH